MAVRGVRIVARRLVAPLVAVAAIGMAGSGCAVGIGDQQAIGGGDGAAQTFSQWGPHIYVVPDGVTSVQLTAAGGSGGTNRDERSELIPGALVTGTLAVQPGQTLVIGVGQAGAGAGSSDDDPAGGWGGLGAKGGNGNAASDTLRTSGAGGGATTIQLQSGTSDAQTVLVAGGGGGDGGDSGDPDGWGAGGSAGCLSPDWNPVPSWTGADGGNGSLILGGKGGKAGAQPGAAGARSKGGSALGGNGGGGGGGVNGGNPGTSAKGTSAAGGGGAGSSSAPLMTNFAVACYATADGDGKGHGDGFVTVIPSISAGRVKPARA